MIRTNNKTEVRFSQPARYKRQGPTKLAIGLIVVFVFLYWLGSGCLDQMVGGNIVDYSIAADKIASVSATQAKTFAALKTPPSDRIQLKAMLKQLKDTSDSNKKAAAKLKAPSGLSEADLWLREATDIRARAFSQYDASINNALIDNDPEVAVLQIMSTWQELSLADKAQARWHEQVTAALNRGSNRGTELSEPVRIIDPATLDMGYVREYVNKLKQQGALSVTHGVAIVDLTTTPVAKISNKESRLYTIDANSSLKAKVAIENQGNQIERDVVVRISLKSESNPIEQMDQKVIDKLMPGAKMSLTFTDIGIDEVGIIYLLTVTAEPVTGEKVLDNNRQELKFVAI